jgi:hypothetical protein
MGEVDTNDWNRMLGCTGGNNECNIRKSDALEQNKTKEETAPALQHCVLPRSL